MRRKGERGGSRKEGDQGDMWDEEGRERFKKTMKGANMGNSGGRRNGKRERRG